jgi:hypothetical protein
MLLAERMSVVAARLAEESHPTLAGEPWRMVRIDDLRVEGWLGPGPLRIDACVESASASRMEIDGLIITAEARVLVGAPRLAAKCVVRFSRGYPAEPPEARPQLLPLSTTRTDAGRGDFQLLEVVGAHDRDLSALALVGALGVAPDRIGVLALEAGVQAALHASPADAAPENALQLQRARFYGSAPQRAPLRVEVRGWRSSVGDAAALGLSFLVQLIPDDGKVWAELELTSL